MTQTHGIELNIKVLLLKTLPTLITWHRENKLVLTRKLPFYWLTFIVTKGAKGPERQKSSADLFILNYNKVKHDETYLVMQ